MTETNRDRVTIASFVLSVSIAIVGVAFWLGGLDRAISDLATPIASKTIEEALNSIAEGTTDPEFLSLAASMPPVGTILAFHGRDDEIPPGWILCNGQILPDGRQIPDLRGRFIRGASEEIQPTAGAHEGGEPGHLHQWARVGPNERRWYSYDASGQEVRVDDWDNGVHNDGSGTYPLLVDESTQLFTSHESNVPPYTDLRFIYRIR